MLNGTAITVNLLSALAMDYPKFNTKNDLILPSCYQFCIGARDFVENRNAAGPIPHRALGRGYLALKIKKSGLLLRIKTIQIC